MDPSVPATTDAALAGQGLGVMSLDPLAIDPAAHVPVVRRALRRLGVPIESLDDAVQDVFTVVVRRDREFDRDRSLVNWLWGIARGVASTHRRSHRRRARLHEALATVPVESSPLDDMHVRADATARIATFVERLPKHLREIFVLAFLHGYSGPEIAERVGTKLNTVYAQIRVARLRFEAEVIEPEAHTLAARIMRAFAPLFYASSKSLATATFTASLVWVGTTLPHHTTVAHETTTIDTTIAAPVDEPAPRVAARKRIATRTAPLPAKEPVMIDSTIAKVALGAALLTIPSVATAEPKAKRAPVETSDEDSEDQAKRGSAGGVSYYDFVEGDRAEGIVLKPEGQNVGANAKRAWGSLIRLRGHFMPELVRLAKDL
jgi:RNA polymerase sigma-70 factor (ECF subfamily)